MKTAISCSSIHGQIFICDTCQMIHLEFGHFSIDFNEEKLKRFLNHLENIDGRFIEVENRLNRYRRKILVAMPHFHLKLMFTNDELREIRSLTVIF